MIPYGKHYIDEDDIEAVSDIIRNGGWLTQGPMVKKFEDAVANFVGAKFAVAVSSATAGLHIASIAAGLKAGQKLVTSPITFVASANAAIYSGAKPVFCDIESETLNISCDKLELQFRKDPDIKVVCPIHFGGLPCSMERLQIVSKSNNAIVIEDAAHALGGTYKNGMKIGSCAFSDMTVFSFHPVKAIAAGEGGMITTNSEEYYRRLIRLRSHGINKLDDELLNTDQAFNEGIVNPWYYEMQEIGFNYRITDIQCALALSQLKKLNKFIERRQYLAKVYDEAFVNLENAYPAQLIDRAHSGLHLYVLRIDFSSINKSRADIMFSLRKLGVGSQVHYMPVQMHPFYQKLGYNMNDCPESLNYYSQALSIPLYYDLTDDQQKHVIESIFEIIG